MIKISQHDFNKDEGINIMTNSWARLGFQLKLMNWHMVEQSQLSR